MGHPKADVFAHFSFKKPGRGEELFLCSNGEHGINRSAAFKYYKVLNLLCKKIASLQVTVIAHAQSQSVTLKSGNYWKVKSFYLCWPNSNNNPKQTFSLMREEDKTSHGRRKRKKQGPGQHNTNIIGPSLPLTLPPAIQCLYSFLGNIGNIWGRETFQAEKTFFQERRHPPPHPAKKKIKSADLSVDTVTFHNVSVCCFKEQMLRKA